MLSSDDEQPIHDMEELREFNIDEAEYLEEGMVSDVADWFKKLFPGEVPGDEASFEEKAAYLLSRSEDDKSYNHIVDLCGKINKTPYVSISCPAKEDMDTKFFEGLFFQLKNSMGDTPNMQDYTDGV